VTTTQFSGRPGASQEALLDLRRYSSIPFELEKFLASSNGGELVARDQAVDFWDVQRIIERNTRLAITERLPGMLLVGSNEGEIALGYSTRENETTFIAVPFGDLAPESVRVIGRSAGEAIALVLAGKLNLDEVCYER
jgi:hypothetical protein